ncbi:COR domain-containing protein [Variovorax rhizosphaerae]|uniref:non-specific serine/threonine protein kinase n=1 Tax=Variovorax rhizosphaerae TaxID=1836200 RepID=A0ABU8WFL7_9BURK
MTPLQAIEALSSNLNLHIRKEVRPVLFDLLSQFIARINAISIQELAEATGYEESAAYLMDAEARITALFLPDIPPDCTDDMLAPLAALTDLELLAFEDPVPLASIARIAALPRLRLLGLSFGQNASAAFAEACSAPSLEGLLVIRRVGTEALDLEPLAGLQQLRSFGTVGDDLVNANALARCGQLRHLSLTPSGFHAAADGLRTSRLESLHIRSAPSTTGTTAVAFGPTAGAFDGMSGLRSLYFEGALDAAAIAGLGTVRGLRTLGLDSTICDLAALPDLPMLEALQIGGGGSQSLAALARFPHLRHLALRDATIRDLAPLQGNERLEFLDLSGNPAPREARPLRLPRLAHLQWEGGDEPLGDAAVMFAPCTALRVLALPKQDLRDIRFVGGMGRLQRLFIADNKIADLSPLATLPQLELLDVSANAVATLAPLAQCVALTTLDASGNEAVDASTVGALQQLETLRLNRIGLTDLDGVKRLRNLTELEAAHNGISAAEPLLELPHIRHVDLSGNRIHHITREFIEGMPRLRWLRIEDNPVGNIDPEIFAMSDGGRALRSLRDYCAGLAQGSVRHDHVKLVLVGNGRVGKTSIVSRLLDNRFDDNQPSTHGIQLREWQLEHVADDKLDGRPLRVTVWDFGGQDIYHATHRIFMRTRALFLLVWDHKTEHERWSLDEFSERYENFGLPYWIDYVKALSGGSPVIVVQNKVDSAADKDLAYGVDLLPIYPPPRGIVDFEHVSARRDADSGMASLAARVREALAGMPEIGRELPAQWVAVREQVARIDRRWLERSEFDALCADAGIPGHAHSVALFLHEVGDLFYEPGQFGDRLVLDQKWAIDAVYALLDRRGAAYRSLCAAGRNGLTLSILQNQVWRHFAPDEHKLLLDFMQRCELCFAFGDGRWYVPQLLPDEMPKRVALRWATAPPHALEIRYRFLHRAIIDRFLVRAGRLGADDEPEIWRNGIVVLDKSGTSEAMVVADADNGRIIVRARGPAAPALLMAVKGEFDSLHTGFEFKTLVSADGGADWVDLDALVRFAKAGAVQVVSEGQRIVPVADLAGFGGGGDSSGLQAGRFSVSAKSAATARTDPKRPEIFISYAWGDKAEAGESREAIVDRLYDRLVERGQRVVRDRKDAGYRAVISEFMQRIGRGELVVAVISDKYLRSPYCMFELLEIKRHGDMRERLFPIVLPDAKIREMSDQLDYVLFWQQQKRKIEEKVRAIGFENLPGDFFGNYDRYYKTVFENIARMTALLNDWNSLSPELLEENSFERLLDAIEERIASLR